MRFRLKTVILLPLIFLVIAALVIWFVRSPSPTGEDRNSAASIQAQNSTREASRLPLITMKDLRSQPDWSELDRFQDQMTRERFESLLKTVYTKNGAWQDFLTLTSSHAEVRTGSGTPYRIRYAKAPLPRPPRPSLKGLKIAIDPGHIGGSFAEMEERHLDYGGSQPIREGAMTLATARLLRPMLEELGAQVTLVRKDEEPVLQIPAERFASKKLFYRTAEIRARGRLVNEQIRPDLVLCLHYNASGSPIPIPGQHFHLLINGAYHRSELRSPDELQEMLHRLLSDYYDTELPLSEAMVDAFEDHTRLPPYRYRPDHPFSIQLNRNPYIYARNLLANRLYHAPVIYFEPYVMNSTDFIARHRQDPEAIYREYAHAVVAGLRSYYSQ